MNATTQESDTARDLLWSLQTRGVELWVEGGQIRYRAPRGALQDSELSLLKTHKVEATRILQEIELGVEEPLRPRAPDSVVPLTAIMLQTWRWMEKTATVESERFCTVSMRIFGPLDVEAVRRSVQALVDRHESLRTRLIKEEDGGSRQHVDRDQQCSVQIAEISAGPDENTEEILSQRAEEFAHEKVELTVGPLFAARMFRVSVSDHVLIMAIDHLLSDGVSLEILNREFWSLYQQATKGLPATLPDLPIQFPDYAVWQERNLDTWKRTHGVYWQNRLRDAPILEVPRDSGLIEVAKPVGEELRFPFGLALSEGLRRVAKQAQTLTPLVVVAIHMMVMSQWYRQRDLTLMFVGNGRYRPELRDVIAFLADFLYLRIEIRDHDTFTDVIRRISSQYHSASLHPSFGRLPELLPEYRTDLHFNWQPYNWIPWMADEQWNPDATLSVRSFELKKVFPVPFAPFFYETSRGIGGTVVFRPDYLRRTTVERFAANTLLLARKCVEDPGCRFSAIAECLAKSAE